MPTSEELARPSIDNQLAVCGWVVQDLAALNCFASLGMARQVENTVEEVLVRASRLPQVVLRSAFEGRL